MAKRSWPGTMLPLDNRILTWELSYYSQHEHPFSNCELVNHSFTTCDLTSCDIMVHKLWNCESRNCDSQFEKMFKLRFVWQFPGQDPVVKWEHSTGPAPLCHYRPFELRDLSYFELVIQYCHKFVTTSQLDSNNFDELKMDQNRDNSKNARALALTRQEFYLIPYSVFG